MPVSSFDASHSLEIGLIGANYNSSSSSNSVYNDIAHGINLSIINAVEFTSLFTKAVYKNPLSTTAIILGATVIYDGKNNFENFKNLFHYCEPIASDLYSKAFSR